jgi:hypothetical protein
MSGGRVRPRDGQSRCRGSQHHRGSVEKRAAARIEAIVQRLEAPAEPSDGIRLDAEDYC